MGLLDDIGSGLRSLRSWVAASEDDVPFEQMQKALVETGMAEATEEKPRALFHDPYSIMDWGGWRQRPSAMTYETLRQMSVQNVVVGAIIQTRTNQVGQFCRPQQGVYDKGYRIVLRDRRDNKKRMSKEEQKLASELEAMIETTGLLLDDERASDRDSFRHFAKKSVRDILTYDQWCHPAGTMVAMADGSEKPIESVEVGDLVLTHLGRVRRVVSLKQRAYSGGVRRFRYRGGALEVTNEHPLLAGLPGEAPAWRSAKDIEDDLQLVYPGPLGGEAAWEAPWGVCSREDARVIGLFVSEGFTVASETRFSLSEWDSVELVRQWARAKDWRCVVTEDGESAWLARLTGQPKYSHWLAYHCGQGAQNKRVPGALFSAPHWLKCSFLRGLLEGDGHWKPTFVVLSTTAPAVLSGLRILSAQMGWYLTWSETANAKRGWSRCWQARFSGAPFRAAMREAGVTELRDPMNSGGPRPIEWLEQYYRIPIDRVEAFEVVDLPVFNLEVEDDHSYVANGVVSHNCTELIRDRRGRVSRFVCLPSETIRPAVADIEHMTPEQARERVAYVQVFDNTIISEFGLDDLAWAVMNPRSDLRANGFGFAPTEMMIKLITAWLYGFDYNTNFFINGAAIKGVLNIKGTVPDRQLRAFRRMWYTMVAGTANAWKTPILNSDDIQWISMHAGNRDMEFAAWMDWLTKLTCACFGVDPVEINFIFNSAGGGKGSMFSSRPNKDEVTESKDRGLVPLMDFISDIINRYIIWELAPELEFSFAGLDAKSEQKERERRSAEVERWRTVDEVREEQDLKPLPDKKGEVILNPVWLQASQGQQQGEPPGGAGPTDDDDGALGQDDGPEDGGPEGGEDDEEDDFGGGEDDEDRPSDLEDSQHEALAASLEFQASAERLRKSFLRIELTPPLRGRSRR